MRIRVTDRLVTIPFRVLLAVLIGSIVLPQAKAENWPTRPIKLINAVAAGSAPDLLSRIIAEPLSRALGQQVIVQAVRE